MENKKSIWIIVVSIIVILTCGGYLIYQKNSNDANSPSIKSNNAGFSITRQKKDNGQQYSNNDWMLMGYMAYAHDNYVQSRHIKNNKELVDVVNQDLNDGALKAEKVSNTQYHLTNKFGSVDVTVESDDIKVSGDGVTTNKKSDVEATFGKYYDKIHQMSKKVTAGHVNNSKQSNDTEFSDEELVVAAFIDGGKSSNVQGKLQSIYSTLQQDNTTDINKLPQVYYSGLYHDKFKGQPYYSIAFNFSTSAYNCYFISSNSDQIGIEHAGGGVPITQPKDFKSKEMLIKKYSPYKADVDKVLQGLEYNKRQMSVISKKMAQENN